MDSIQLVLDENNLITEISVVGTIDGGVDYSGELPEGFIQNFKSNFYMLKDGQIIKNADYSAPKDPEFGPNNLEKQIAALGYQQMIDSQTIETLQNQNAQMAYQIMTGGNQ